ncbi:hypothetical protein ETH_00041530 [Eimeria tenella]|uniref:Uncharacterized protein n=1 Tax=Eimeria tenella TaxID=5802 RepID=U6L2B4_EIMTE|nr:hypothetical protein ETH_00041530 [Eimeria tenella]CDJ44321.1 hypothetical protein ETH_00041530 [Eimeria tenella]|eukprot:XP_013235070.1 hypothetical protein ETH_00041530 [Eimeria tenella]
MAVWGSSWDRLRPHPIPAGSRQQQKGPPRPSPLFALPDCLFPQLLAVQTSSSSSSSSSRPYRVFLNTAFAEEAAGEPEAARETPREAAAAAAAAAAGKKAPCEDPSVAAAADPDAQTPPPAAAVAAAAAAAAADAEEALMEWARSEASTFEGPLGGDQRNPARPFCCSFWRDKLLGVGGPLHMGGALHLWDAASGCLCSSSVSPYSQQPIRCVAPDPRGAPLALTGGLSPSKGGVVVMWAYLTLGQLEDAGLLAT